MNWVIINFKTLLALLLPSFLRKKKQLLWLSCLLQPLEELYGELLYKMQHTSQVIYLEKLLNEHFEVVGYDPENHETTKQITIEDASFVPVNYVYLTAEIPPYPYLYLGTKYISSVANYTDFIVKMPASIPYEETKLRLLIDYYKLAGKQYEIRTT